MDWIAEKVGVVSGTVYRHFPAKADLAVAVMTAQHDDRARLRDEAEALDLPVLDRIAWLASATAQSFRDDVIVRAGVRLGRERNLIDAEVPAPFEQWLAYLTEVLTRGQHDGEVRPDVDCGVAAYGITAAMYGMQEMSSQIAGRQDLVERVNAWWAQYRLLLEP